MSQLILCVTDSNFENIVLHPVYPKDSELFLVDFWAEWCAPCRTMSSIIEDIAIEFNKKLTVAKLNIDDNPTITKKYNIRSIPTLLLIQKGVVLSTLVGVASNKKLREFVSTYL